jgi:hypothetical protein
MVKKKKTRYGDRILNCSPSRDVEKDWKLENAVQAGLLAARAALPASKDLRAAWWKIGDQKQTGPVSVGPRQIPSSGGIS